MTKQQSLWLNRCIVIIILFASNLGAAKTDAQDIDPSAAAESSTGQPTRLVFDVTTGLSPEPIQNSTTTYSYKIAAPHPGQSITSIFDVKFSQLEMDVPARNVSDPNLYSPAMSSLLEIEHCPTPMTLMLHSSFGASRMQELADQIRRSDLVTMTYRGVLEYILQGQCPPSNAIIVSIDDLGSHWLRDDFKEMIQVFTDRNLVLVVGLIVHGPQNPEIWDYLRELDEIGVEIASHSIDHYNLPQINDEAIQRQVVGSYETICEHLGKCPITFILPFGNIDAKGKILEIAADYTFVVGIQGGRTFAGKPPWYLGRSPPHETNQSMTLEMLQNCFQSESTSY